MHLVSIKSYLEKRLEIVLLFTIALTFLPILFNELHFIDKSIFKSIKSDISLFSFFQFSNNYFNMEPISHGLHYMAKSILGISHIYFFNIIIHIANAFLLFKILNAFDFKNSFLCTLLFSIHPIHFKNIIIFQHLNILLATFFILVSIHLLIIFYYSQTIKKYYSILLILFTLSLLSNIQYCALPLLALFFVKKGIKDKILFILPFIVISLLFLLRWEKAINSNQFDHPVIKYYEVTQKVEKPIENIISPIDQTLKEAKETFNRENIINYTGKNFLNFLFPVFNYYKLPSLIKSILYLLIIGIFFYFCLIHRVFRDIYSSLFFFLIILLSPHIFLMLNEKISLLPMQDYWNYSLLIFFSILITLSLNILLKQNKYKNIFFIFIILNLSVGYYFSYTHHKSNISQLEAKLRHNPQSTYIKRQLLTEYIEKNETKKADKIFKEISISSKNDLEKKVISYRLKGDLKGLSTALHHLAKHLYYNNQPKLARVFWEEALRYNSDFYEITFFNDFLRETADKK